MSNSSINLSLYCNSWLYILVKYKPNFSVSGISEELEAQVLEMPFQGKRASMFVFLPQDQNNGRELENMLKRMNPGSLLSAMRILDRRDVVINFPKFKFEKCLGSELRLVRIYLA